MSNVIRDSLWLYRDEPFVLSEQYGILKPGQYRRVRAIPAPGLAVPPFVFVVSTAIILGAMLLVLWRLSLAPLSAAMWPAILLGCNSALRGSLKFRERMAALAEWDKPVGRERVAVRIAAAAIGLVAGSLAGFLLGTALRPPLSGRALASMVAALSVVEGIRNALRIGGTFPIRKLDIEAHTNWYLEEGVADAGREPSLGRTTR